MWNAVLLCSVALGQAEGAKEPAERPYWLDVAKAHIAECEVKATAGPAKSLKLHPEPVFHHIQNTRGKSVGSVFVYLEDSGRPAAVGDVFLFPRGKQHQLYNEWHSLSAHPLVVNWNGAPLMNCAEPGIRWQTLAGAPATVSGDAQRERQLRQIARRFTAHLKDRSQEKYELRLLTTPLYQYRATEQAAGADQPLIGGFFAFCQETDPEIFLLIELQRGEEEPRWKYAAAEFSNMDLFLQLDGKEVWKANPPQFSSTGPHFGGKLKDVDLAAPAKLK